MSEDTTTTTPYRGRRWDELMAANRALDLYRAAGDELMAAQRAVNAAKSAGLSFDEIAKRYRRLDVAYKVYGETEARVINERSRRNHV